MCNRTSFDTLLDFGSVAEEFLLDCYDLSSLHMNAVRAMTYFNCVFTAA